MVDRLLCPHITPFVLEMEPGEYAYCKCGSSGKLPFCDGAHKGTPISPLVVKIEAKGKVAWCGCRHTKSSPFCDATHKTLR